MPIINAKPGGLVFVEIDIPKEVPETCISEPPCEIVGRVVFHEKLIDAEISPTAPETVALEWRKSVPTVEDLRGAPEEFFWVRGGNFNRMVMARANIGINSEKSEGRRRYFVDINFSFFAAGIPPCIWSQDLSNWPGFGSLEWAGPVHRPATIIELKK